MRNVQGWLIGIWLLLTVLPAQAETSATAGQELQALTAAVNRLAAALEQKQTGADKPSLEKLNLAIAYLDFRSRRIEQLEKDIGSARTTRSALESNLRVLDDRQQQLDDRKAKKIGMSQSAEDERELESVKLQRTRLRERLRLLDDEVIQQENRIYELKHELGSVEDYVRRNLEF